MERTSDDAREVAPQGIRANALAPGFVETALRHQRQDATRLPLGAGLRDPPRGTKTRAIGIEQQGRHHARIERRLTKTAFVACDDLRQIQVLARQSDDEMRQMVRRHIIDDRRRQELCLINCPRTKMSAHASKGIKFVPKMPPLLGHAPNRCDNAAGGHPPLARPLARRGPIPR